MRTFILLLAFLGFASFAHGATYRTGPNYRKSAAAINNPSICDNFHTVIYDFLTVPAMEAAGFDLKNNDKWKMNNGNNRSLRSRGRRLEQWEDLEDAEAKANAEAIKILTGPDNALFGDCLETDIADLEVDIKIQHNKDSDERRQLLDTCPLCRATDGGSIFCVNCPGY